MQTLNGVELLAQNHPFLAGLKPELYGLLTDCASLRRFASQQQIFIEGGEADHFYLIVSGAVDLETFVPGRGMLTIQKLGANDALGWSWLFAPYKWHFTATTTAPTEVISLNADELRARALEVPELHDELVSRVARTLFDRFLGTREQLINLYKMRPERGAASGKGVCP